MSSVRTAASSAQAAASTAAGVLSYASSYITPLLSSSSYPSSSPSSSSSLPKDRQFDRDMDRLYHIKVRPLLDAVDQLRGLLSSESEIKLPTIVVVGDQSSGKSSVLEALSGVALPRGQNITTRCPLILRLINTTPEEGAAGKGGAVAAPVGSEPVAAPISSSSSSSTPSSSSSSSSSSSASLGAGAWAVIGTSPVSSPSDEKLFQLSDVTRRIESLTSQLAGRNAGVTNSPIYLSVYRPHSPDLTLVDLPGITRNPIGEQPKDIYKQIVGMLYSFIRSDQSVILNVMPATVDLPTCECVMMSKEVDPMGERTIGVVTKLDLAEKGIKQKLLTGVEQLNLRLGVVAVRNRTQEENDRGITWEMAREMEKQFFQQHSELAAIAANAAAASAGVEGSSAGGGGGGELCLGTQNLATLLTNIQEQRIRSTLPKIRMKIRDLLLSQKASLSSFPPAVSSPLECRIRFDSLLNNYVQTISALCRGDHTQLAFGSGSGGGGGGGGGGGDNKLHLNPRCLELYALFQAEVQASASKFLSLEYGKVVEEEIKENNGCISLPNFLSSQVFKGLIYKEMGKVNGPAQRLVEAVRMLLSNVLVTICKAVFASYPNLIHRMEHLIHLWMDEKQALVSERVNELLQQEEEIFTINSYYMDTVGKVKAVLYDRLYQSKSARSASLNPLIHVSVNDLTLSCDLRALTLSPSTSTSTTAVADGSSASAASPAAGVFPSNTVLDMQINCYSYVAVCHKRLCDGIPLLIRYHLVRGLTEFGKGGLYGRLQREFSNEEKNLMEWMKEDKGMGAKREKLVQSIGRLEKALAIFEKL